MNYFKKIHLHFQITEFILLLFEYQLELHKFMWVLRKNIGSARRKTSLAKISVY